MRNCYVSHTVFRKRPSPKTYSPAEEHEYALKQSRCCDALEKYFVEARKTIDLIRRCRREPGHRAAAQFQVVAQRDREAAAQRSYLQARKLLLHLVKVSCLPRQRDRG